MHVTIALQEYYSVKMNDKEISKKLYIKKLKNEKRALLSYFTLIRTIFILYNLVKKLYTKKIYYILITIILQPLTFHLFSYLKPLNSNNMGKLFRKSIDFVNKISYNEYTSKDTFEVSLSKSNVNRHPVGEI